MRQVKPWKWADYLTTMVQELIYRQYYNTAALTLQVIRVPFHGHSSLLLLLVLSSQLTPTFSSTWSIFLFISVYHNPAAISRKCACANLRTRHSSNRAAGGRASSDWVYKESRARGPADLHSRAGIENARARWPISRTLHSFTLRAKKKCKCALPMYI